MELVSVAAVGGRRLRWEAVPESVRDALETEFGARVVAADSREGGFSPALASVLTLDDGRTLFAKAVSASRNDFSHAAIRAERRVLADLPQSVPAPRLLWGYDDGEWTALVTDAAPGRNPQQPWRRDELERFIEAATVLADALTPAPIDAPAIWEEAEFWSWSSLAEQAHRLPPWIAGRVDELARLDTQWPDVTRSDALMHGDLRGDNVVLGPDGGFVVVDWPSVRRGAPWLDLLFSLPSIAMHGGGEPGKLWVDHRFGRAIDPDAANVALAGFAGFLIERSLQPVPALLPTIRQFQRVQAEITLNWLFERLH
jgi:aminoglycoside phosphotransferase (APT) family kinase protein